eukprot:g25777.t1
MRGGQWPIRLVDVGAHLGDCTLWSAARWSSGVRVLAVEMRKDHSANIRRASGLARHPQGIVEVQAIQVVAEADCAEEQDIQTMDCILDNWKLNPEDDVHLVSLYLGFRVELDALRGALRWKETAFAIAKTAEVRTELAASQLELTEAQQARRKLTEQTDSLNQLIQRTQAHAAILKDELTEARASEAGIHELWKEELSSLRSESEVTQLREELRDSRFGLQVLRDELEQSRSSHAAYLEDLKEELQQARHRELERIESFRDELRTRSDCIAELQARDADRRSEFESHLADARPLARQTACTLETLSHFISED